MWIEPVTSCTDTNLTFGFSKPKFEQNLFSFEDNSIAGTLTDDGGFANLPLEPPGPSWFIYSGSDALWNISPPVPDLQSRADQLAYWNNFFTSVALNVSGSFQGATYGFGKNDPLYQYTSDFRSASAIEISPMDGGFLNSSLFNKAFVNRTGIKQAFFHEYGVRCAGYEESAAADATKPFISCGYLYGMPQPALPGQSYSFDLGSRWKQPLYTCAGAIRASVKTVTFTSSGSSSLSELRVTRVADKVYAKGKEPLWAVEIANGLTPKGLSLFWGMVSESHKNDENMFVRRSSDFYLPTAQQYTYLGYSYDGFAAGGAFGIVWNSVFNEAARIAGAGIAGVPV